MELQLNDQVILAVGLAISAVVHGFVCILLVQKANKLENERKPMLGFIFGAIFTGLSTVVYGVMWFTCIGRIVTTTFWPGS